MTKTKMIISQKNFGASRFRFFGVLLISLAFFTVTTSGCSCNKKFPETELEQIKSSDFKEESPKTEQNQEPQDSQKMEDQSKTDTAENSEKKEKTSVSSDSDGKKESATSNDNTSEASSDNQQGSAGASGGASGSQQGSSGASGGSSGNQQGSSGASGGSSGNQQGSSGASGGASGNQQGSSGASGGASAELGSDIPISEISGGSSPGDEKADRKEGARLLKEAQNRMKNKDYSDAYTYAAKARNKLASHSQKEEFAALLEDCDKILVDCSKHLESNYDIDFKSDKKNTIE